MLQISVEAVTIWEQIAVQWQPENNHEIRNLLAWQQLGCDPMFGSSRLRQVP